MEQENEEQTSMLSLSDEALIEQLIDELLEGYPRAEQWGQWSEALEERLQKLMELKAKGIIEFPNLDERIEELQRYITALHQEKIIIAFIEQQVRMIVRKAKLEQALDELGS